MAAASLFVHSKSTWQICRCPRCVCVSVPVAGVKRAILKQQPHAHNTCKLLMLFGCIQRLQPAWDNSCAVQQLNIMDAVLSNPCHTTAVWGGL